MNSSIAAGKFVVSVHDVAPASIGQTCRWLRSLDARGIPATLLIIAGPWRGPALNESPELITELHAAAARGHELSLHGWSHAAVTGGSRRRQAVGRVVARGAAEFCALDEEQAALRLRRGLTQLRAAGIEPTGFTPPGWLAAPGTVRAARRLGLRYITSHWAVRDLATGRSLAIPALSHRPGARSERLGSRLLGAVVRHCARNGRPFRIALHPDDLARQGLRGTTLSAIDTALAAGLRPVTYADLLGALPGHDPGRRP
ncbi:deacetylase [Streptomyces griseocarneus]|nr:deacetylase [Streptomyces griseocarneus]